MDGSRDEKSVVQEVSIKIFPFVDYFYIKGLSPDKLTESNSESLYKEVCLLGHVYELTL